MNDNERAEALRLAKEAGFDVCVLEGDPRNIECVSAPCDDTTPEIVNLIRLVRQSARCEYIRSSDEGTHYCALAQSAPQDEPSKIGWCGDHSGTPFGPSDAGPERQDSAPEGPVAGPHGHPEAEGMRCRHCGRPMPSVSTGFIGNWNSPMPTTRCECGSTEFWGTLTFGQVASPPAAASAEPFCYALTLNGELCSGENVVALLRDDLQLDSHQEYAAANEKYEAIPLYTHPAPDADSVALLGEARTCMHDGYFNRQWHGSLAERIDAALARKP